MSDLFQLLRDAAPMLLQGTAWTLVFALASMLGGLSVATVVASLRLLGPRWLARLLDLYVSAFRGTPLLVQVFVIYYGLPSVGLQFEPLPAGVLALSLNAGAYLAESLRGAIAGVPEGQWAAAASLGMSRVQTLRHIVAPQALRLAVPSLGNTLISLIKDTSLVSVIAVTELMLATKELISTTFQPLPLYLAAAAIYWLLSVLLERAQQRLERSLALPK
ncbi:amino acid ABC transporter permease [Chitinimonas taiwanensis]|uniref:Putative glutamine transport system permease protein GlnP n=1 Tax=Chitinimonas taiwanensis DSM 18899 TaxID=1121279 RepID=A0A1K2HQ54_9NEIS|nr:amino acid ABC transporter permease [Chitinimonas taiwanensis]SFZ78821.1 amino acid ABC transporter membrane protein, PAAT family (TC 3.A.1.3.-) [Chitinimonas taiwanensis DSM 18899]